jgi:hypothetical protein
VKTYLNVEDPHNPHLLLIVTMIKPKWQHTNTKEASAQKREGNQQHEQH